MILDIGCGNHKTINSIGIDLNPNSSADIRGDITGGLPFRNSCFSKIICNHVIEHIEDLGFLMLELRRILKKEGIIEIRVPYAVCIHALSDYTHKHFFTCCTLEPFFNPEHDYNIGKEQLPVPYELVKLEIRMRTLHKIFGLQILFNIFKKAYEKYFLYLFPAKELFIVLKAK